MFFLLFFLKLPKNNITAVDLLFFFDSHVCIGLIVRVRSCAQRYMPPPGSMGVTSLWHHYCGDHRPKSSGNPVLKHRIMQGQALTNTYCTTVSHTMVHMFLCFSALGKLWV